MDINIVNSKIDQVLSLMGLNSNTKKISEEQKAIISEMIEVVKDPLIDAFYEAKVPKQFSVIIEDIGEGINFKLSLTKL
jgi:ribosomal protein L30/L7E